MKAGAEVSGAEAPASLKRGSYIICKLVRLVLACGAWQSGARWVSLGTKTWCHLSDVLTSRFFTNDLLGLRAIRIVKRST